MAVIHGEQKEPESERLDGRQSPPPALAESQKFAYTFTDNAMDLPGIREFATCKIILPIFNSHIVHRLLICKQEMEKNRAKDRRGVSQSIAFKREETQGGKKNKYFSSLLVSDPSLL